MSVIYDVAMVLTFIEQKLGENVFKKSFVWIIIKVERHCLEAYHVIPGLLLVAACLPPHLCLG